MSGIDRPTEALIAAALADRLTTTERAALSRAVAADPAVATALARACWIDEGLQRIFSAAPAVAGDSVSARLHNAGHRPRSKRTRRRTTKRRPTVVWWGAAGATAALLLALLFWPSQPEPSTSAAATVLVGRIEADAATLRIDEGPAVRRAALRGDEAIHSSGPARLSADGLRIACTGSTSLRLVHLRGPAAASRIDLLQGELHCAVDQRKRSGAVTIATPVATVQVTGTRFRVRHDVASGTAVQVKAGQVQVESAGRRFTLHAGEDFISQPVSSADAGEEDGRPRRWHRAFTAAPDASTVTGSWQAAEGGFLRGVPGRTGVQASGRSYPTRNVRLLALADERLAAGPGLRLRLRARVSHAMHSNVMLALEDKQGVWQGNVMAYPDLTEAWQDIELAWADFKQLTTAAGVSDLAGTTIDSVVVQIVGGKTGVELEVASVTILTR